MYAAEQREPIRHRVAIKVLKAGMDSRAVVRRFQLERRALALVDHPNVARVLDGGVIPEGQPGAGRPFFSMEYFEGVPITEYADANGLGLAERIELIRQDIAALGDEMNALFDRIDAQLNLMYSAIVELLGDVADNNRLLQSLVDQMVEVRSSLRRIESRLYGILEAYFGSVFTNAVDDALDRYDDTGFLLDYRTAATNFVDTASYLKNFATTDARALANPAGELSLDTADDLIGPNAEPGASQDGEVPFAPRLNQLRALVADPEFGFAPLASTDTPAIEPWAQAASAYAQLMRENPWYFGFGYGTQLADYNAGGGASPPELWNLIETGEEITALLDAIRNTNADGQTIYEVLIELDRQAAAELQQQITAEVDAYFAANPSFQTGNERVRFWDSDAVQAVPNLAFDLGGIRTPSPFGGGFVTLAFESPYASQGYNSFTTTGFPGTEEARKLQLWATIMRARHGSDFRLWGDAYLAFGFPSV